ncbi:MAG: hypothetical protein M9953_10250 [Thermomicrobiales bacterium]|nr:hypothetical protein [Thermomicrobiales bacterium]MCO5227938.1 hypothetical protein [Thermomicrobiales bacterium]
MNTRTRVTAIPTLLAAAVAAKIATPTALLAQDEAGPFDDLGLEKLSLVVTPDSITGMPEELAAGHYLVELSGEPMEGETSLGTTLFRFPEGMTLETMPAVDTNAMMLPEFLYEGGFAGGRTVLLDQGETSSQYVITLTPGDWMISDSMLMRQPMAFKVTGEISADAPTPAATLELTMGEMYFHVTGGDLTAGTHILSLTSMGGQPHFLVMLPLPPGMTNDEFEAMFTQMGPEEEASAESGGDGEEEGGPPVVLVTDIQSLETTIWTEVELASGTYGLACFFPDQHVGMPHVMLGMHAVIDVP